MPIRAERAKLYPGGSIRSPEWLALRDLILQRAHDRCEGSPAYPDCRAENGKAHPVTGSIVVLTIAHLTHDETCDDPEQLRAWCQRCHNTYDLAHRRSTSRARLAVGDLFDLVDAPAAAPAQLAGDVALRDDIDGLQRERDELLRRAEGQPPRSITRRAIELRLVQITARLLQLEARAAP